MAAAAVLLLVAVGLAALLPARSEHPAPIA
jgi:hypothetical protein